MILHQDAFNIFLFTHSEATYALPNSSCISYQYSTTHSTQIELLEADLCAGLHGAVNALKQNLQELGSDLVILHGPMESVLPDLVNSLQASSIILEEEVEYRCAAALAQLASGHTVDSLCLNSF